MGQVEPAALIAPHSIEVPAICLTIHEFLVRRLRYRFPLFAPFQAGLRQLLQIIIRECATIIAFFSVENGDIDTPEGKADSHVFPLIWQRPLTRSRGCLRRSPSARRI